MRKKRPLVAVNKNWRSTNKRKSRKKMEWASKTFNLIDEYKKKRILWNSDDSCYKMPNKRDDAWSELGAVFDTSASEVKRKMNSLLASYRRERMKMRSRSDKTSRWFAYHKFDFLDQLHKPKQLKNGQNTVEENSEEQQGLEDLMEIRIEESSDDIQITETKPKFKVFKSLNSTNKRKFVASKKRVQPNEEDNGSVREFLEALRQSVSGGKRDELDVYGEYIANEIRKLNPSTQFKVKHLINNIIYEAQASHENPQEFSSSCVEN